MTPPLQITALALAAALAAAPGAAIGADSGRGPARAGVAGAVMARDRLSASHPVTRTPRTYAFCAAEARKRRLRGAERRHFIQRCRLGYTVGLFRRRPPATSSSQAASPPDIE